MRRFVLGWKMLGLEQSLGSRIVTYADDLVILCRRGKAEEALRRLREIMGKLKLTVNEEKTRICKVPEGQFDFLGYTFGRMYSARTGKAYLGFRPVSRDYRDDLLVHIIPQHGAAKDRNASHRRLGAQTKRRELDKEQRRAATAAILIEGFAQRTSVLWRTAAEQE